MPKATSGKLSSAVRAAGPSSAYSRPTGKGKAAANGQDDGASGGGGGRNHLFDTAKFGQHILMNPLVAQGIVDKANLKPTDIVLEVGPGTGNLTVRILEQVRKVVAVEMDPRMASEVKKRVMGKPEQRKLEIILGDFVKAELPYFDVCISNTPYQVSQSFSHSHHRLPCTTKFDLFSFSEPDFIPACLQTAVPPTDHPNISPHVST